MVELKQLQIEKDFLEKMYHTYTVKNSSQTMVIRKLIVKTFVPYLKGGCALELGCSDGFMTEMLSHYVDLVDVVDGSTQFINEAANRKLENVKFICSLFEQFQPRKQYDYVIASYILEHVLDPTAVLRVAKSALLPNGLLFVVVPNARALSRQLALHMGLLEDLKQLTPNDHNHGHRRVYDRQAVNRELTKAGFRIIGQGGVMLKILADFQMDQLIDSGFLGEQQISGLYSLGLEYPDLCGSLFSICQPVS